MSGRRARGSSSRRSAAAPPDRGGQRPGRAPHPRPSRLPIVPAPAPRAARPGRAGERSAPLAADRGGKMSGQSITDRIAAAQHSVTGSAVAKAVCKATTHEVMGPKKKHLDCECGGGEGSGGRRGGLRGGEGTPLCRPPARPPALEDSWAQVLAAHLLQGTKEALGLARRWPLSLGKGVPGAGCSPPGKSHCSAFPHDGWGWGAAEELVVWVQMGLAGLSPRRVSVWRQGQAFCRMLPASPQLAVNPLGPAGCGLLSVKEGALL